VIEINLQAYLLILLTINMEKLTLHISKLLESAFDTAVEIAIVVDL
jgi:hypothetical protein